MPKRKRKKIVHRSFDHQRTKYCLGSGPVEMVLADEWEKENQSNLGSGMPFGILQELMRESERGIFKKYHTEITPREAKIVATAIQWLGTNCGYCWLESTLKKAGIEMRRPVYKNPQTESVTVSKKTYDFLVKAFHNSGQMLTRSEALKLTGGAEITEALKLKLIEVIQRPCGKYYVPTKVGYKIANNPNSFPSTIKEFVNATVVL